MAAANGQDRKLPVDKIRFIIGPAMPSVFLSRSSRDKEFVRDLYRRLKRDGVDCFFDTESTGWGDNWVRALERALDECSDIVFGSRPIFVTPSGSKSNGRVASPLIPRGRSAGGGR
jgi:hypothetical protein